MENQGAGVYPLLFEPILVPKVWGGRRLETHLHKRLPPQQAIGESWELADLDDSVSVIRNGPAQGRTIRQLISEWGEGLYGRTKLIDGRLPLLIKFLDAAEPLSIQVHPDEQTARRMGGNVRGKREAWYVIHAEGNGVIYRGLREGIDAEALRSAIQEGRVESTLQIEPAKRGHGYYLPGGTVHALGGGVLVAEVQVPSDTTFRLYDWGRVDESTGRGRDLHIDEALECISFDVPSPRQTPQHVASVWTAVTSLVNCDAFGMERVRMVAGVDQEIPYAEMVIWIVLEGRGRITYEGPGSPVPFGVGDTVLLPAALKKGRVQTEEGSMWLEVAARVPSSLAGFGPIDRYTMTLEPNLVSLNVPGKKASRD